MLDEHATERAALGVSGANHGRQRVAAIGKTTPLESLDVEILASRTELTVHFLNILVDGIKKEKRQMGHIMMMHSNF
jgi:hypothetical protein